MAGFCGGDYNFSAVIRTGNVAVTYITIIWLHLTC